MNLTFLLLLVCLRMNFKMSEFPEKWRSCFPLSSGFEWEISELLHVWTLQVLKAAATLQRLITGSLCTGCMSSCLCFGDEARSVPQVTTHLLWVFQQDSWQVLSAAHGPHRQMYIKHPL